MKKLLFTLSVCCLSIAAFAIGGVYGFKVDQGEIFFGDTVQTSVGSMTNVEFRPYYYNSMFQYITGKKVEGTILGRPFSHQGRVEASVDQLSLGWWETSKETGLALNCR